MPDFKKPKTEGRKENNSCLFTSLEMRDSKGGSTERSEKKENESGRDRGPISEEVEVKRRSTMKRGYEGG